MIQFLKQAGGVKLKIAGFPDIDFFDETPIIETVGSAVVITSKKERISVDAAGPIQFDGVAFSGTPQDLGAKLTTDTFTPISQQFTTSEAATLKQIIQSFTTP